MDATDAKGRAFSAVFGDGEQLRGMTYVDDVARANLLACERDCSGATLNIGGGSSITVNQLIGHLERIVGKEAQLEYVEPVKGDARDTFADITSAGRVLDWRPEADLVEGLERTVASMGTCYFDGGP